MENPSIKSIIAKIGVILCLVGVVLITLTFIYHENIFCLLVNTLTKENIQTLYLLDEKNNKDIELSYDISTNKKPKNKVEDGKIYIELEHYNFIQNSYKLVLK